MGHGTRPRTTLQRRVVTIAASRQRHPLAVLAAALFLASLLGKFTHQVHQTRLRTSVRLA